MKPSLTWPEMGMNNSTVMRSCLSLSNDTTLLCLRGGIAGEGEIALRFPLDVDISKLLDQWAGLNISRIGDANQPDHQIVRIAPSDNGYRDLYVSFVDDLWEQLQHSEGGEDTVQTTLSRMRLWSSFLVRSMRQLSNKTVRGLFAELCALEQFLIPTFGWEGALTTWTGPAGHKQDITTNHAVIDIKATSIDDQLVTISNIEQLDPPKGPLERCRVLLLQAQLDDEIGESLHTLIDRLISSAKAASVESIFTARLRQIGITEQALSELQERLFKIKQWYLYPADAIDFPRLQRSLIPEAIISASYRIDLGRTSVQSLNINELPMLLKGEQK